MDQQLLGELATLAALMAGTIMYSHLIRRREAWRQVERERDAAAEAGVRGLVRVFLSEPIGPKPQGD